MNKLMTVVISISSMSLPVILAAQNVPPPPGPYKSVEATRIHHAPSQSFFNEGKHLSAVNEPNSINQAQSGTRQSMQWRENRSMPPLERQNQAALDEMRNMQQYRQFSVPVNPAPPLRRGPVYGPAGQPPSSYANPTRPAYPVQNRMNTYPPVWR